MIFRTSSHFWVCRQGPALFHKMLSFLLCHEDALWRLPEKNMFCKHQKFDVSPRQWEPGVGNPGRVVQVYPASTSYSAMETTHLYHCKRTFFVGLLTAFLSRGLLELLWLYSDYPISNIVLRIVEEPGLRQLLRLHLQLRGPVLEAGKTVLNLAQLRKLSSQ